MRWGLLLALVGCTGDYALREEVGHAVIPNSRPEAPTFHEDRIRQVGVPAIDVLWVVDNSCSMWEEQKAVAANYPSLVEHFVRSELDYHVGVVSTDMRDPGHRGRLRQVRGHRFITPETPDAHGVFADMVMVGVQGHWDEQGLEAAYTAIDVEAQRYNVGFLRPDAVLHVIVISDENDYSAWSPAEFAAWLHTSKWTSGIVSFSSIVGPREDCPTMVEPGTDYLDVTHRVGGVVRSICSDDWAEVLDAMGREVVLPTSEFFLSQLPVDATIEVEVRGDGVLLRFERDEDWVYDARRNSVRFLEYVPEPRALVVIRYALR